MNAVELRYGIYKYLTLVADVAALEAPEPGQPPEIKLYMPDPCAPTGAAGSVGEGRARHYRITIEETD